MAHPKRKISKSRRNKRRTHYKASITKTAKCSHCGTTHEYHRLCPECGFYRGKLAISKDTEE